MESAPTPVGARSLSGAKGTRTPDPHTASVVRYQLRHSPRCCAHRSYTTACQPSKSLITAGLAQRIEFAQTWRLLAAGDLLGQQPPGRWALLHAPHAVPARDEDAVLDQLSHQRTPVGAQRAGANPCFVPIR